MQTVAGGCILIEIHNFMVWFGNIRFQNKCCEVIIGGYSINICVYLLEETVTHLGKFKNYFYLIIIHTKLYNWKTQFNRMFNGRSCIIYLIV